MAHLILVRHAKAIDRMDADDDFERGLTPRGMEDAKRAGEAVAASGVEIDQALVSPSARTLQTFQAMSSLIGEPPRHSPMALYHASPDFLRRAAAEALAEHDCVLLVGHNPGIGTLALDLAFDAGAGHRMPDGYPTSAVTVFTVDGPGLGRAGLVALHNPKG